NHIGDPAAAPAIEKYFAQHETGHYAILRTTAVPTVIKAGFRTNVIPSEAEATLDVRALPDEDMDRFYAELRRVIGDPRVEVVPGAGHRRQQARRAPTRPEPAGKRQDCRAGQDPPYVSARRLLTQEMGVRNAQLCMGFPGNCDHRRHLRLRRYCRCIRGT